VNTGFYILAALVVAFALVQILIIRRRGDITEAGWRQIREIIFETINDIFALYQAAQISADRITDEVVRIVRARIEGSAVPAADKAFWTEARLRRLIDPVVRGLLEHFRSE